MLEWYCSRKLFPMIEQFPDRGAVVERWLLKLPSGGNGWLEMKFYEWRV